MKYEHLLGRPYKAGVQDCYELARQFYRDNCGIELTNYARPGDWWNKGLNLLMDYFYDEGFRTFEGHPRDWRAGDAFLMNVNSGVANHCGIYLGQGTFIHHPYGRFSEVVPYSGAYRNRTLAVIRHKDQKKLENPLDKVQLMDLLPPHKRHLLEKALEQAT